MSTLIYKLGNGVIIECGNCTCPVKEYYYVHLCEYSNNTNSKLKNVKMYCFSCLEEKGECRKCKRKYIMKASHSI